MEGFRRLGHESMATVTKLQGQYLAFIDAYTKLNGRPPAESEMQRYFGVTAPVVHQMIMALHRKPIARCPASVRVAIPQKEIPRPELRE